MENERFSNALARVQNAAGRIEQAAARIAGETERGKGAAAHDAAGFRREAEAALAELDQLIARIKA